MSRTEELIRELQIHRDELSDELARLDQALVVLHGKEQTEAKEQKEFGCDLCEESFANTQALGAHKRNKHGIIGASKRSQTRQKSDKKDSPKRAAVLELFRELARPASMSEIAERLQTSKKSASNAISALKKAGALEDAGYEQPPEGGRRPTYRIASVSPQQQRTQRREPRPRIEHLAPPDMSEEGGDSEETVAS